ncbi:hypothetical protein [Streptomyces sulphureus]|uniref:hypothetical protein n=1 Tax=Streptomyces sulphureus TaxID=47758 RepID=UPI0003728A10|nr:hypothetical protein [Streptomyces sulphureus]
MAVTGVAATAGADSFSTGQTPASPGKQAPAETGDEAPALPGKQAPAETGKQAPAEAKSGQVPVETYRQQAASQ